MHVRYNAGVRATNQRGRLGNFPEPMWCNPKGVANILSLDSVKRHYRVTYDSAGSDAFIVTDKKGIELHFKPTKNGLCALRGPTSGGQEWSFLNTVSGNKDMHTKREQKAATRARKVQNIMMHPSTRQHMDIADQHLLRNNPAKILEPTVTTTTTVTTRILMNQPGGSFLLPMSPPFTAGPQEWTPNAPFGKKKKRMKNPMMPLTMSTKKKMTMKSHPTTQEEWEPSGKQECLRTTARKTMQK